MELKRSLKIVLAVSLAAAALGACSRRGSTAEESGNVTMTVTANETAEPAAPPENVTANAVKPNMTPPKPQSNDGAFGPDYAPPPASAPPAAGNAPPQH